MANGKFQRPMPSKRKKQPNLFGDVFRGVRMTIVTAISLVITIFVVTMGDEQKAIDNLTKTMKENPAWATLEAVQQDRMHFMDKKMFNLKPNAKWAQSYEQLCEVFYESK